jgi:hypothetical protein
VIEGLITARVFREQPTLGGQNAFGIEKEELV